MASYYNPSKRLSEWAAASLSPYIKLEDEGNHSDAGDSQKSSLSVGLWSGHVELKNVELRREAFDKWLNSSSNPEIPTDKYYGSSNNNGGVKIRWKLLRGSIDSLIIKIPWKGLIVGSSHCSDNVATNLQSSAKMASSGKASLNSVPEKYGDEENNLQPGNGYTEVQDEEENTAGCTTVQIHGVFLTLGYEIIHEDPVLRVLQSSHGSHYDNCSDSDENDEDNGQTPKQKQDDLQNQIREEKDRILQTAERRILAGLDPFPENLMSALQCTLKNAIQSGMQTGIQSGLQSSLNAARSSPTVSHSSANTINKNLNANPSNAYNKSFGSSSKTVMTNNTHKTNNSSTNAPSTSPASSTYLSKMENYVSSALSSLLWRTFDSLSLSVTQVQVSVMGCSHYDKDMKNTLRKKRQERNKQNEQHSVGQQQEHVSERSNRQTLPASWKSHHHPLHQHHPLHRQTPSQLGAGGKGRGHQRTSSAGFRSSLKSSDIPLNDVFKDSHRRNELGGAGILNDKEEKDGSAQGHRRQSSWNSVGWGANTTHTFSSANDRDRLRQRRASFPAHRSSTLDEGNDEDNTHADSDSNIDNSLREGDDDERYEGEDPTVWSLEGQIELGLTLDRFDVRPGSLSHGRWGAGSTSTGGVNDATVDWGPSSLKHLRFHRLGVFLRRKRHLTSSQEDENGGEDGEAQTEKTLLWHTLDDDDYIVNPTNFEAFCRLYRNHPIASATVRTESVTVATGTSSIRSGSVRGPPSPQEKEGDLDNISTTNSTALTGGSQGTSATKRRGKRDKRPKRSIEAAGEPSRPNVRPSREYRRLTSSMLPLSLLKDAENGILPSALSSHSFQQADDLPQTFHMRPRNGIVSNTSIINERAIGSANSTSPPPRLCLNWKMGHIRSSLSSRQIFLLHSFSSSLARMKQGRPLTTIRAALANDQALLERMAEDGQSIMAWDDHIFRTVPSLRAKYPGQQKRTVPRVVSLWWKYALLNVVKELRQQATLLDQCCGDHGGNKRRWRGSLLAKAMNNQGTWDWAKQTRIRKEYIELYLLTYGSPSADNLRLFQGEHTSSAAASVAAIAAAKLRLRDLEDELSVERILLLKHVARASSIRAAEAGDNLSVAIGDSPTASVPSQSSPANEYYFFPPNSHAKETRHSPNRRQLHSVQPLTTSARGIGDISQHHRDKPSAGYSLASPTRIRDGATVQSRASLHRNSSFQSLGAARNTGAPSISASKKGDLDGYTAKDGTVMSGDTWFHRGENESKSLLSFYVSLELSGVSLALCDTCENRSSTFDWEYGNMEEWHHQSALSDDVSALTGFSDADDTNTPNQAIRRFGTDAFDPMCRFWPSVSYGLCHEPILLMHVVDLSLSARTETCDQSQNSSVACEFSVGGVAAQGDGMLPSSKIFFSLGHESTWDSKEFMLEKSLFVSSSLDEAVNNAALSGFILIQGKNCNIDNHPQTSISSNVGVATVAVDWNWIEKILGFSSENRDIEARRILSPLDSEVLLMNMFSTGQDIGSSKGIMLKLDFEKISLSIPLTGSHGAGEDQFLLATVDSLMINIGTPNNEFHQELDANMSSIAGNDSPSQLLSRHHARNRLSSIDAIYPLYFSRSMDTQENSYNEVLFNLEGINIVIATRRNDLDAFTSKNICILQNSFNTQVRYSSGKESNSPDKRQRHNCQSVVTNTSPIIVLISEHRLRAVIDLMDNISNALSIGKVGDSREDRKILRPSLPTMSQFVLKETQISFESLSFQITTPTDDLEDAEDPVNHSQSPKQLENIVATFILQLSCLDFKYPNVNTIECMVRLSVDQCCASGLLKQEATDCIDAAQKNFREEVSAIFDQPRDSGKKSPKPRHRGSKQRRAYSNMDLESLSEVMEEIVERATQKTMASYRHILQSRHSSSSSKNDLYFEMESLDVSQSFYYCMNSMQARSSSVTIRNGKGTNLLNIHPDHDGGDEAGHALTFSLQERTADSQYNCQEIYVEAGNIDAFLHPEACLDATKTCQSAGEAFSKAKRDIGEDTHNKNNVPPRIVRVNGILSSVGIVLTDKLIPFIRCCFHDVAIEKSVSPYETLTKTSLLASAISLECISPTGSETYPDIITTYHPLSKENFNVQSALGITFTEQKEDSRGCNAISVDLHGVRILLLRQFLNECIQYTSSPQYGFGVLSSRNATEELEKEKHHIPSTPFQFNMSIKNSSIVLPRDSKNADLVSFEVEEIFVTHAQATDTWSVDNYSFSNKCDAHLSGQTSKFTSPLTNTSLSQTMDEGASFLSSSSSDNFFDCVDGVQPETRGDASENKPPKRTTLARDSSMQGEHVSRVIVQLKGARVFTALNDHHFSVNKINMPLFNRIVQNTGRAETNKKAFKSLGTLNDSMMEEIESRIWKEVTMEPLSLKVTLDMVPHLRLLIEDGKEGNSCKVAFDMRMSQLYLLMSVWYSNMQEFPLMFPYEEEFIENNSISPDPPLDWPEYGTDEFVNRIKFGNAKSTFDMALCFKDFSLQCAYDPPGYFSKDPLTLPLTGGLADGVRISVGCLICKLSSDEEELVRIGLGATKFELLDLRNSGNFFVQRVVVGKDYSPCNSNNRSSFADLNWGLDCGRHTLIDGLPLPFQVTVFMTPDMHCMINLGIDMIEAALVDLSPIWILLDYFGLYFKEKEYGNPAFSAEQVICMNTNIDESMTADQSDTACLSIDFRLWLISPHVVIPSNVAIDDTCIMIEAMSGVYYRFKSFGINYSSQDVVAKDLGIIALREYMEPAVSRGLRQVSGSLANCGVKTLIDGLSFSVKYDFNASTSYTRLAVQIPLSSYHFDGHSMQGIEPSEIDVKPFLVPPPLVCKPFVAPSRHLGHHETTIYFSHEYMQLASDLLMNFVGPGLEDDATKESVPGEDTNSNSLPEQMFSVAACVERVKLVISDPIMGMHRPIMSICLPKLQLSASQLQDMHIDPKEKVAKLVGRGISSKQRHNGKDLQASLEVTIFIDYFKLGLTRSWEPFLEPVRFLMLHEKSSSRGKGVTLYADCPLHVNITGETIETIDDAIETFQVFWVGSTQGEDHAMSANLPLASRQSLDSHAMTSVSIDQWGHNLTVHHNTAELIEENERIAYSFKNRTGQRVRVHTHSALETDLHQSKTTIVYIDHLNLMPLSFPATFSITKNLESVEVPFEGDQNRSSSHINNGKKITINHVIDVQVPGFKWVRGVSIDKIGKHFVELIPRSPSVQKKINADWRLKNILQLLTEVNSVNGGRRLSITSPFEIVNKTDHPIFLAVNPDPRHFPKYVLDDTDCAIDSGIESEQEEMMDTSVHNTTSGDAAAEKLNPDEIYSVSHLLLESALRLKGNHLGSIWIRPDQYSSDDTENNFVSPGKSTLHGLSNCIFHPDRVGYPSRPIQLAKILNESSQIFRKSNGDPAIANQYASGIEVSCPIFDDDKSRKSTPFCYVIEVKRSPLVRANEPEVSNDILSPAKMGKVVKSAKNKLAKNTNIAKTEVHAPVAYSLIIHPPIVIENLLPERGRFELMNATTRNVVWWGNLEPGEKAQVHHVGLDAPLLLFINMGFCRTPVGEGALVHHGGGDGFWRTGWNSLGSAMKMSKDKVKRTLYTMAESQGNRGAGRVAQLRPGNTKQKDSTPNSHRKINQLGSNTETEAIESSAGGVMRRGDGFGAEDVASETCVLDSMGQRITLHIDNVLGSGGQRRITLYCPFWIVNTTEHSLRYKQEKTLSFVSGTVLSPEKDGSKPVDGSNRNDIDDIEDAMANSTFDAGLESLKLKTIFSGTPGALTLLKAQYGHALKPAVIATLISEDLPLSVISKLAFMFNFQDVLSLGGPPRLCVQLADTTGQYTSSWSAGFSLESVGVTQIVGMHCKDGRGLEVSVSITLAPGRLSNYTKIVRICPRYIVVNQLSRPIRLWQDNSIRHPNLAVEDSPDVNATSESRKWVFSQTKVDDIAGLNQYKSLFGAPTVIDCSETSGVDSNSTTAHHTACYIATVHPSELVTFHLPDTRADRLLRVDYGSSWNLSSSFPADEPGEYFLPMSLARDIRMLPTVSTRAAPVYTVTLPPPDDEWNGELGVWFETEWGRERSLIVKATKINSCASFHTDIVVGDELIRIDGKPVDQLSFDEAMEYLKMRLAAVAAIGDNQPSIRPLQLMKKTKRGPQVQQKNASADFSRGCVISLTFLTLEERMRRLRRGAIVGRSNAKASESKRMLDLKDDAPSKQQKELPRDLLVDMKFLFQSVFIFVREPDQTNPPHKIINRSLHWDIYYRQRACDSHPWKCLSPGESAAYTWEEPMKPKKLSVRAGVGEWIDSGLRKRKKHNRNGRPIFSFQFIENEEQGHFGAPKTVKLEEIGFSDRLPCPSNYDKGQNAIDNRAESTLHCYVDTEGATRVLIISDEAHGTHTDDETLIRRHLSDIRKDLCEEEKRRAKIEAIKAVFIRTNQDTKPNLSREGFEIGPHHSSLPPVAEHHNETGDLGSNSYDSMYTSISKPDADAIELELQDILDYDEDLFITKRNQVIVEVLEATGLKSSDLNGLSNPYCKVSLIQGKKKNHPRSFTSKDSRSTYFVEKTLSPQWCRQAFVFDVPEKASHDPRETRRLSLQCVIKSSEKLGKDKFLGQSHIHLRNLRDQKENIGWFPLMGKLGQRDIGKDSVDRVRGSIRLRVQWVHDLSGLLDYYCLSSDHRLETLRGSKVGMKRQLATLQAAAKQKKESADMSFIGVPSITTIYKKKKSFHDENDKGTKTKEDKHPQQPNRIMQGVRAKEKKLMKSTMAAARWVVPLMKKARKESATKSEIFLVSEVKSSASNSDRYDRDDSDSSDASFLSDSLGTSSYDSLDFKIQPKDRKHGSMNRSRTLSSNDNTPCDQLGNAINGLSNAKIVMFDTHSNHLLYLRQQCWENHFKDVMHPQLEPSLTSWTISRAFVNAVKVAPRRPRVPLATAENTMDDDPIEVSRIVEMLQLPHRAPVLLAERENNHMRELMRSRSLFSKACSRALGSVVNLGGVLTIRPITALNLPDTYTGMFVKVRTGGIVRLSETVDSKVVPVWTADEMTESTVENHISTNGKRKDKKPVNIKQRSSQYNGGMVSDFNDIAEMVNPSWVWGHPRKNDLRIQVDPFETSKSLRLSVIGERLQSKVELGCLEIPLGPALECCAQSMEDYEEDINGTTRKGLPPAYVRWFPLIPPSESTPIEGDMGQSTKPKESEKLNDNMFREYFAPCIKLALMFQADTYENNNESDTHETNNNNVDPISRLSTDQYLYARLYQVSAALIDSSRVVELLSFSSRDADLRISVTKAKTRLGVAVGCVQMDQQSIGERSRAPVVLAPTPVKHPQPTVQFLCWKDNIRSKDNIDSYEYVALQVQEMDLKIEESWLYDVWLFYMDIVKKKEIRVRLRQQESKYSIDHMATSKMTFGVQDKPENALEKAAEFLEDDHGSKKLKRIYVAELILGYMKVNLSYFKSVNNTWAPDSSDDAQLGMEGLELYTSPLLLTHRHSAQSGVDAYSQWSENMGDRNTDEVPQHFNMNIISAVFPSISEAPIRFQGKIIEHVFESEGDIWRSLQSFYAAEALKQIYKILGSLDFVGNPTMVLSSFATGLRDFFLQPSREFKHIRNNPSRVGVGVLKGTLSLFSNSASGIFGFASHLGATVGHTATILTLDDHFQSLHAEQKAAQQRHYDRWKKKGYGRVTLMVTRPFHDIVFGVLSAATGLLTEPYRGAKTDGAVGFSKGVAVGIIGVAVKPIVGLSDAFAHVMESIHDIAKSVNLLEAKFKSVERYRLPYVFGPMRTLLPFNQVDARSAQLLLSHPFDKKARKGEEIIVVSECLQMGHGHDQYIVVSTKRVILFKLKPVDGQGFVTVSLVWQVRFEKGVRISSSLGNRGHNSSILYVSRSIEEATGDFSNDDLSFSSHKKDHLNESYHSDENKFMQSNESFFGDGRTPSVPETPRSNVPGPFRVRAWPFTAAEGDGVTRFVVEGDFKQRSQLSRVHNAICCLFGEFDSIDHEGNANRRNEGITTFGPLVFERPQERSETSTRTAKQDLQSVYSSLERTSWMYDGFQQVEPLLSDMLRNSTREGGPSWLVEARAQGMFVPPPPPPLPSNIDPTNDEVVSRLLSELERGMRSYDSTAQEIYSYARSLSFLNVKRGLMENQMYRRSAMLGQNDRSVGPKGDDSKSLPRNKFSFSSACSRVSHVDSSIGDVSNLISKGQYDPGAKSQSSEVTDIHTSKEEILELKPEQNFIQRVNDYANLLLTREEEFANEEQSHHINPSPFINEVLHREAISPPDYFNMPQSYMGSRPIQKEPLSICDDSTLDGRLRRVEALLEHLVSPKRRGSELSSMSHSETSRIRTLASLDQSVKEASSSFNPLAIPHQTSQQSRQRDLEVEALKMEIDALKQELAAKNSPDTQEGAGILQSNNLEVEAVDPKSTRKKGGRLKNILNKRRTNKRG